MTRHDPFDDHFLFYFISYQFIGPIPRIPFDFLVVLLVVVNTDMGDWLYIYTNQMA